MHMIVGFLLASLLRNKSRSRTGLPSIRGKLETVHALPGRLRFNSQLLMGLKETSCKKIGMEIKKIDGIESVEINPLTGSLLIIFNASLIQPFVVHGIAVKVLGLEDELEKSPSGFITREMDLIGRSLNQQIYQSSGGLMDLRSSFMLSILILALYRIVIQGDRTIPGGINLLWWAYVLMNKGRSN